MSDLAEASDSADASDPDAAGPAGDRAALIAANPFPGLRSFRPAEADRFFGRQQQIDELVALLAQTPFIAVSGASGCGKSSLVLAGLLNELKRRHDDDFETDWRPVVMRPGSRPIARLAEALARVLGGADLTAEAAAQRADTLYGQLRLGGLALAERVRQSSLPAGTRVLVVVDQFEEIFRFKRMADGEEASAFVKLLLQAAAEPDARVSAVITLRSDTLGACADFRDLAEAASRGGYLVPRLKREQRKEAIVRPVELCGARIAPRLVQRLLNDVSDDFDDLPVMQHALSRTWRRWAEACGGARPIDLEDYLATGGAASALNEHADEACRSLGALGQASGRVERVLRALTERVAEGTEVRRPLDFEQLCAVCGGEPARAEVIQVVERFRRADTAFLVPGPEQALADNPVIDISHESLIRQWAQLRGWVLIEAEAATELRELLREAEAQAQGRGEPRRGLDLQRGRDWQRRHQPNAAWVRLSLGGSVAAGEARFETVRRFLDLSDAAEQRRLGRDRLRRRGLLGLGATVLLASVAAAVVGIVLQRQASARDLVSRAELAMSQDPVRSAQHALAAIAQDRHNPRAEVALRQAMASLEVASTEQIVELAEPLVDARYSDDGQRLLAAGGRRIWLLNAASLKTLTELTAPAPVVKAWQLDQQVISFTEDLKVQLQTLDGQRRADLSCSGDGNGASSVAYSRAQDKQPAQLAVGCRNGQLELWALGEAGVIGSKRLLPGSASARAINALGFSGDGRYLASGDADGQALVWQRGQADKPWIGVAGNSVIKHARAIRDISFHPSEPTLLATASDDRSARVWTLDFDNRRLMPTTASQKGMYNLVHDRAVLGARFVRRADDPTALMSRSDKRVFFWSDETTSDARSHKDTVTDVSASADGELIVSASADGTAHLWSSRAATSIALLRGHRNEVTRAFFSPQGDAIITTSRDRTLRKWRLTRPVMLAAGRSRQLSAAIDEAGQRAVLCGEARPEQPSQCRVTALTDLAKRADTSQEWLAPLRTDAVESVSLSPDGKRVLGVSASLDRYQTDLLALWDADSRSRLNPAWLSRWRWARFNSGRAELVALRPASDDGASTELAVFAQQALSEQAPGQPLFQARIGQGRASRAELSADGRWVAAQVGSQVLLWDRQNPAAAPRELKDHQGEVRSLAFSRDSQSLVTASNDRTARVWAMSGAAPVLLQGGHSAALTSAAFSPDGKRVLTGGTDNSLQLWDAAGGQHPRITLTRHANAVNAVMFNPAGQSLLSASDDGTVRFDHCGFCSLPLAPLQARADELVRLIAPPDEPSGQHAPGGAWPRWLGGR